VTSLELGTVENQRQAAVSKFSTDEERVQDSVKPISKIDVSAFGSVLLFLLALFMVPGLMYVDLPRNLVDLPKVGHPISVPHARREDAILVAIMRNGDVFLDGHRVFYGGLPDRIRMKLKNGSEGIVYVQADTRGKYRDVKDVLDQVRSSGVQHVVFLADQRKSGPSR
jgi:biopolymer transport protein ExbD/biopolymer transport protein TolR